MITQEELKKILHYNPETGRFTWLASLNNRVKIGMTAGCAKKRNCGKSYRYIKINGISYLSHRLAWLYTYKQWPAELLDHIDGNTSNNRLDNLRESTHVQNGYNKAIENISKYMDNTKGFTAFDGAIMLCIVFNLSKEVTMHDLSEYRKKGLK